WRTASPSSASKAFRRNALSFLYYPPPTVQSNVMLDSGPSFPRLGLRIFPGQLRPFLWLPHLFPRPDQQQRQNESGKCQGGDGAEDRRSGDLHQPAEQGRSERDAEKAEASVQRRDH